MISFLKKYFGALYLPVIWTFIIGILMCLPGKMLPNESGFAIPEFDKFVHMSLFGGFVFLWALYISKRITAPEKLVRWFFVIFVLANLYGIGMEYLQKYYIPMRDFDLADIIADMAGAGLAYGCSHLFLLPKNGTSPKAGADATRGI